MRVAWVLFFINRNWLIELQIIDVHKKLLILRTFINAHDVLANTWCQDVVSWKEAMSLQLSQCDNSCSYATLWPSDKEQYMVSCTDSGLPVSSKEGFYGTIVYEMTFPFEKYTLNGTIKRGGVLDFIAVITCIHCTISNRRAWMCPCSYIIASEFMFPFL